MDGFSQFPIGHNIFNHGWAQIIWAQDPCPSIGNGEAQRHNNNCIGTETFVLIFSWAHYAEIQNNKQFEIILVFLLIYVF